MNKSKCPVCGSKHTIRYGIHKGVQTYKCADCGYRFRNSKLPSDLELWKMYQENKRSQLKNGKTRYRHRRLRSAVRGIDFYLPYLFTYQGKDCEGMPNTNNKLEGIFTDLKKNLNNHSGMNRENRKRFICGFFLALI